MTASERDLDRLLELRARFEAWAIEADPARLVFIDESGSNIAMTREYARALVGERAPDKVPRNRGTVTSMVGALSLNGIVAMMTIEGGTDADVFLTFVKEILLPEIEPGYTVVLDNAGAHKTTEVLAAFAEAGIAVKFLPPYSPELNPIEMAWAKVKDVLRFLKARTQEALDHAIALAMDFVTPSDAGGWFRHCGYRCQVN